MTLNRDRLYSARLRVNVCALIGLAAGASAAPFAPWQLSLLVGWIGLTGSLLAWIWTEIIGCDATTTRARSTAEDDSRITAVAVMVTASVVSLVGVACGLAKARHVDFRMEVALTAVSVLAVVLSWSVVHSMFTLRYAHQYYSEPTGGIEFPGDTVPDYRDFAYFAFTIGMSFAVSDTNVTSQVVRRITLRKFPTPWSSAPSVLAISRFSESPMWVTREVCSARALRAGCWA